MSDIDIAVTEGASLLDQYRPGWERLLDLSILDLSDEYKCVLGQLYGEYWNGCHAVPVLDNAAEFGFDIPEPSGRCVKPISSAEWYHQLDQAWISLIKNRFDTGKLSDS